MTASVTLHFNFREQNNYVLYYENVLITLIIKSFFLKHKDYYKHLFSALSYDVGDAIYEALFPEENTH